MPLEDLICTASQSCDEETAGKPTNGSRERARGGQRTQAHPSPTEAASSRLTTKQRAQRLAGVDKMAELRRARTHCKRGHEFTPENTYAYKGHRQCKICKRDREFYWRHGIDIRLVMP